MNEERALLQTIREHPNDDTPRLAYARWLGKHGKDALGQFIRCEVMADRLPKGDSERRALERQANGLLEEHREEWEQPLRRLGAADVTYDRGLPVVTVTARAFLDRADELFAENPRLVGASIMGMASPQLREMLALPHLEKLTHLSLEGNRIDDAGARDLAACTSLRHLTHLSLWKNRITETGARAIAESPHFRHLAHLNLGGNRIGDDGVKALADSQHLRDLVHLDLWNSGIGDDGVRALANSQYLHKLKRLDLTGNDIGGGGATAIATSQHFQHLVDLCLGSNRIDEEGARALAASSNLPALKYAYLEDNGSAPAVLAQIERDLRNRSGQATGKGR